MMRFLAAAALALAVTPAAAQTVTFDEFANPTNDTVYGMPLDSGGLHFADSGRHGSDAALFWAQNNGYNADPNGATFTHNYGDTVTVTRAAGGTFNLVSLDLAHAYNEATAGQVTFSFTDALGTTTDVFSFNALARGLQTYTVNRNGLLSFSWDTSLAGGGYPTAQFDNIKYTTGAPSVPEPATWAMMILGMGAAGVAFRRRTDKVALAA